VTRFRESSFLMLVSVVVLIRGKCVHLSRLSWSPLYCWNEAQFSLLHFQIFPNFNMKLKSRMRTSRPSVYHFVGDVISTTTTYVEFSWNLVQEFFTESCRLNTIVVKIVLMTIMFYLRVQINFYRYCSYFLTDLVEIWYSRSRRYAVK
jgi:hypothetical protein